MDKLQDWVEGKLGEDIWKRKYQFKNESFDEWLDRVSGGNRKIKNLILAKKFIPAGRILANRGLSDQGINVTYSNCFVQKSPEDNLESIFDTAKEMARTYSYGGGVGTRISKLRPKGAKVHNAAEESTGAVSFMDLYANVTDIIAMKGRRGALMISMEVSHPDIMDFINAKEDHSKINTANISVEVTDEFMQAVQNDDNWVLSFETDTGETIENTVKALDIFNLIAENNWKDAEPGLLYISKADGWNILSEDPEFEYAGVNP